MEKINGSTLHFEEEEGKLYVAMSVANPLTTEVTAYNVCVEFLPGNTAIKVGSIIDFICLV